MGADGILKNTTNVVFSGTITGFNFMAVIIQVNIWTITINHPYPDYKVISTMQGGL